ncbi:MAG: rRNA (Adenine-N(6)-)-methyltransferase [Candidatus Woesebacteria bacterium GW2011_GWA1_39_21b]|nr:MAG: hypothetical protein US72_C0001G0053 [Microgenomates group bacterium GW2011_GWC1_38_12]KKR14096.1 MAG: rRNA (Adenine-N(6)-)-methyltransferase [Candidatus Woesebacteria bacterium GW2011_GWA1_39_21b]
MLYSQNRLINPGLVADLVGKSSIGENDVVLEIGPGKGIITQELLNAAKKVIAVEIDEKLYLHLKNKFSELDKLVLVRNDFLKYKLPGYPFKVFANTPFVIISDVIRKLTDDKNFQQGYLIVQKEAAKKFIGKPQDSRNQMISVLLYPWFEIRVYWEFERRDFIPKPSVDCVMIDVKRRDKPLLSWSDSRMYKDFILYLYNKERGVAGLKKEMIVARFEDFFKTSNSRLRREIERRARKIEKDQKNIKKIHRTRVDRNWKRFG